ncbi:MAG: hypothetical protein NTW50_01080 [Candidatus Berkelbacteria bacterium]|nr:hypothetical protein [Candidatus Berkelbacteria bacterium]
MNQVFYLENDEEITGVVGRIRKSEKNGLVLVIPRGGTLGQSLINLKLLKRSARETKKAFALVTTDSITKNLAKQQEIEVFGKVSEAEKADLSKQVEEAEKFNPDLKVKHYKRYNLNTREEIDGAEAEPAKDDDAESEDAEPKETLDEESQGEPDDQEVDLAAGFHRQKVNKEDEEETSARPEEVETEEDPEIEPDEDESKIIEEKEDEGTTLVEQKTSSGKIEYMERDRKSPRGGRSKVVGKIILYLVLVVVFLGIGAAYAFFPKADVHVTVTTTDLSQDYTATVDANAKAIDDAKSIIPGHFVALESEQTKSYTASGKKDVGAAATGTITISNSVASTSQVLAAGTKVNSADGKSFTLQKGVIVPGATLSNCQIVSGAIKCDTNAGTIDATVVATENGDGYNLAPTTFTIGKLTAANKTAFSGGITKFDTFVTDQDLASASTDLKKEILAKLDPDFAIKEQQSGLEICDKCTSNNVVSESSDQAVNAAASTFNYRMKMNDFALGFNKSDVNTFVASFVAGKIKSDETVINPEQSILSWKASDPNLDTGSLKISGTVTAKIGKKLDISKIKLGIKNQSLSGAAAYLKTFPGVESATISVWPSYIKRLPILTRNMQIYFDYKK